MTALTALTLALSLGVGLTALGRALQHPEPVAPQERLAVKGAPVRTPAINCRPRTYADLDDVATWARKGTTIVPPPERA